MKNLQISDSIAELILEEFEGSLSESGKTELKDWISRDPENEIAYGEFQAVRNNLDQLAAYRKLDAEVSWGSLKQKIDRSASNAPLPAVSKSKIGVKPWIFSAAAVLICVLSITLYKWPQPDTIVRITVANEKKTITLPDGSQIFLNANTSIKYNETQFKTAREVSLLNGEAFFEIVHDARRKFKINMGELRVTDLGTSFNVKKTDSETTVIVNSGEASFEHLSFGDRVILTPGEKGTFVKGTKEITDSANSDINYKSWIDKKLIFRNKSLALISQDLEKTYGFKVFLNEKELENRKLNATLNYQTIDSALLVITKSLQLKVHKTARGYILDTK